MNGASEATLQDLLAVNKEMAHAIKSLAAQQSSGPGRPPAGGSGGGGSPPVKETGAFKQGLQQAGSILSGTFSKAASLASAGLNSIVSTGKAVIASQQQLAEGAINGTNGLSSFAQSLSNLPGPLGMIAQAYAYQQKILEKNLHTYQAISDTGANLGSNLSSVRDAAKGMGLSMDEFAKTMKDAGPELARMGGTAGEGSRALVKFNREMIQGEVGRGLLGMGYSLQEANGLLANYSSIVGGLTSDQLKDQKKMEQSVNMFATELEVSAQLEGKSRQQKEQEMKKAAENAAVQARLSSMTDDEKAAYTVALSKAMREGGQGAVDLLNAQVGGFVATSKEAQMTMAVMPKVAEQAKNMGDTVNSTASITEKKAKLDEQSSKMGWEAAQSYKAAGQAGKQIAGTMSGPLASAFQAGANTLARQNAQGVKSLEDKKNLDKKAEDEAQKKKDSEAGRAAQAEARAKYQAGLMDRLYAIMAKLFPVVEFVVKAFTQLFEIGLNFGTDLYNKVIEPAFKELFGNVSVDDIIKPFKDFFKGLFGGTGEMDFDTIKEKIVAFVKPIKDFIGNMVGAIDFEAIGQSFRDTLGKVFGALGKVAGMLGKLFGGGGVDGAEVGGGLQKAWTSFMNIIGGIADIIGSVIDQFTSTPAFQTMEEIVASVVKIFTGLVNILKKIVVGPVGTWLVGAISAAFELFITPFKFMITAVEAIVDIVDGICDMLTGDVQGGFDKIVDGIKTFIHGIVDKFAKFTKFVLGLFGLGDWANKINDSIKGLFDGIIDFFAGFAKKVLGWFSSSSDEAKDKAKAAPPPAAGAAPDPTKWAHDVYVGDKKAGEVPAEIKGKVQELMAKPPQSWVDEVNKKQQSNNQAKTEKAETPKAETPKTEAAKPATPPPTDLNNKDALQILKTIADYQYKTIGAVKDLNGNLLKR